MTTTYDLPDAIQTQEQFIAALPKVNDIYRYTRTDDEVMIFWDDGIEQIEFTVLLTPRQVEFSDDFPQARFDRLQSAFAIYKQKKPRVKVRERIQDLINDLNGTPFKDITNNDLKLLVMMLASRANLITEDETNQLIVSIPELWYKRG